MEVYSVDLQKGESAEVCVVLRFSLFLLKSVPLAIHVMKLLPTWK